MIATVILGAIHRQIGIAVQQFQVGGIGREKRDAHGRTDEDPLIVDIDRLADRSDQPGAEIAGLRTIPGIDLKDGEFVTADTGDKLVGPQVAFDSGGDFPQQSVADGVAKRVIDVFEVVQVDVEQGELLIEPAGLLDGEGEALVEQGAVRQRGQRIMAGEE